MSDTSLLEMWQRHVLECRMCGESRTPEQLCQVGKNFWRVPGSSLDGVVVGAGLAATAPVVAAVPVPVPVPAADAGSGALVVRAEREGNGPGGSGGSGGGQGRGGGVIDIRQIANRVAERVMARTGSGAVIAVPMEKTSTLIEFSTAPGVTLRMPERDIEVYTQMKAVISRMMRLAEALGTYLRAAEETRSVASSAGATMTTDEVALVVAHVGRQRGIADLTAEGLYEEFSEVMGLVVRLGDVMGRLMRVDAETQAVIRATRTLGVEMKVELERSYSDRLVLDNETRGFTRSLRMTAISLQGELERRLGT